jgi:hypothetical protein
MKTWNVEVINHLGNTLTIQVQAYYRFSAIKLAEAELYQVVSCTEA